MAFFSWYMADGRWLMTLNDLLLMIHDKQTSEAAKHEPWQNVRGSINAAMSADASNGCSAGLQELEAAVTSNWNNLFADQSKNGVEKMKSWWKPLETWIMSEPAHPLRAMDFAGPDGEFSVLRHTTFGKLHAQVRVQCTCNDTEGTTNANCCLHGDQIALTDLVWEIVKVTHEVFNDQFMSFANVFLDETVRGGAVAGGVRHLLFIFVVVVIVVVSSCRRCLF